MLFSVKLPKYFKIFNKKSLISASKGASLFEKSGNSYTVVIFAKDTKVWSVVLERHAWWTNKVIL